MFILVIGLIGLDIINMKWKIEMFYMFKYIVICFFIVNKLIKYYYKDIK